MATQKLAPKLFAVTLIRSRISRPWWQRKTLDALGLKRIRQTMIHKNTPSVCGLLNKVKEMIDIKPVVFRTDLEHSLTKKQILLDNGEFFVSMDTLVKLKNEVTTQPTSCQDALHIM